jgi:hypothetical protein
MDEMNEMDLTGMDDTGTDADVDVESERASEIEDIT